MPLHFCWQPTKFCFPLVFFFHLFIALIEGCLQKHKQKKKETRKKKRNDRMKRAKKIYYFSHNEENSHTHHKCWLIKKTFCEWCKNAFGIWPNVCIVFNLFLFVLSFFLEKLNFHLLAEMFLCKWLIFENDLLIVVFCLPLIIVFI